jgi:hypothetical protein
MVLQEGKEAPYWNYSGSIGTGAFPQVGKQIVVLSVIYRFHSISSGLSF